MLRSSRGQKTSLFPLKSAISTCHAEGIQPVTPREKFGFSCALHWTRGQLTMTHMPNPTHGQILYSEWMDWRLTIDGLNKAYCIYSLVLYRKGLLTSTLSTQTRSGLYNNFAVVAVSYLMTSFQLTQKFSQRLRNRSNPDSLDGANANHPPKGGTFMFSKYLSVPQILKFLPKPL